MSYSAATRRNIRSALLLGAASIAVGATATAALAQDAVETVVVTGSRIPQVGLYSTSPVTAVGQQEIKLQGATNVETLLRNLPATFADGDSQTANNGSGGEETIDLRGLGTPRTLVLVDGKRLVPADNIGNVDLSVIPAAMVDHVEVLTGGSSAVYGADAVAGVINIILRKDFEGMEIDGQYSQTGHSDGITDDVNVLMGMNSADGKGNVTIYGGYTNRGAVSQANRKISAFALHDGYFEGCAGGPKGTPGSTAVYFQGLCRAGSGFIAEGIDGNTSLMFTPDRTAVPYDGRTYNFAPLNYFQTPDTRYTLGASGHYEVNKSLDIYTRLTFADHAATTALAPTPISAPFAVNFGNPLLSDQEKGALFTNNNSGACDPVLNPTISGPTGPGGTFTANDTCQIFLERRLVGNGNRVTNFDFAAFQMVIGAKGDIGGGWAYDVSAQYGHTLNTTHLSGDASGLRFQQGLLVNPDGTCQDPSGGCVPIDIFASGAITPAQKDFFTQQMVAVQETTEWDMVGSIQGDFGRWGIQSPWAKTPVGAALGAEYRQEQSDFEPDDNLATGNLLGFGQAPAVHGRYNVTEGFGELRVPLVEDQPFFKSLQLDGAYRYSSYDIEGVTNTYKYGAQWSPVDDFTIRGSFQRAVRAPNISEIFGPNAISQNAGADACSALGAPWGHGSAALCQATGVPSANYLKPLLNCVSGQCTAVVGGNPNVKPEIADTRSLGIVLTPTFFDGFTATVDYFDIKIVNVIGTLSIASVMQGCYDPKFNTAQDPTNSFCQLIHRDSAGRAFGNSLAGGRTYLLNQNVSSLREKGIDFEANYQNDLDDLGIGSGWGSFAFNLTGTWLDSLKQQLDPTQPVQECAGLFGDVCGLGAAAPQPVWKTNTRLTWYSPDNDVSLSVLWRHLSSVDFDEVKLNHFVDPISEHIPSFDYFDVAGTWAVSSGLQFRAGVNNVFEKSPPAIDLGLSASSLDSGNTFPGTYDVMGRTFFVGATAKF